MSFAVIKTGGKQYKVKPGDKVRVEKLDAEKEGIFIFDKVLLVVGDEKDKEGSDPGVKVGAPYIDGAKVESKVLNVGREKKKIVFKYKPKKRYRKKKGHRQHYTEVEITKISA